MDNVEKFKMIAKLLKEVSGFEMKEGTKVSIELYNGQEITTQGYSSSWNVNFITGNENG